MLVVRSIEQRGFKNWYERELVRSHSHLVLLILCTVAALAALEAFSQSGSDRLLMVVSLVVAAVVGAWAMRRYLFFLMRAEQIANQASCGSCNAYARWRVESSRTDAEDAAGDEAAGAPPQAAVAMAVCCRQCGHRWRIEW